MRLMQDLMTVTLLIRESNSNYIVNVTMSIKFIVNMDLMDSFLFFNRQIFQILPTVVI